MAVIQTGYTCMGSLQPLDTAKLESLSSILFKLVEACLDASEPPGKWSITHSRKIDPGENAAVMVRIDQYLSDLAAYRDDAHLAAWQKHACSGHAWELLTVFWREGAQVFDDLFQRLAPRGYLSEETRAALTDLVDRNWVQLEDDIYRLTNLGQQVRVDAEAETDRFFYQPWSCLSNQENITVQDLVSKMKNALDVSREA